MTFFKSYIKFILLTICITSFKTFAQTPPNSAFTSSTQDLCVQTTLNFTNQSTAGTAPITTYTWDFGDGNSSTNQNPSHSYTAAGTYTVTLVVQASNGQADSEVKIGYIVVRPKPSIDFSTSTNGCSLPVGVTFNNLTTDAVSYQWDFGNGQTSTAQTPPVVNYTTAGNYTVRLIATSSHGCIDTLIRNIVVSNFQAGINAPTTACVGTPVTISDNSTVGANAWNWGFPGATPNNGTASSNSVTYNTPGTYTISLQSQNTALSCTSTTTKEITVVTSNPSFTNTPNVGCTPLNVTFTNTGAEAGATYLWLFGDGSSSTSENPSHNYTTSGSFDVTLIMTSAQGCINTVSVSSAVTTSSPIVEIASDVREGCADLTVQFTGTGSSTPADPIVSWNWIFGDGTTYNGETPPPHIYGLGKFDVRLEITTQNGCIGIADSTEFIKAGQLVDSVNFDVLNSPQCVKTDVNFEGHYWMSATHDPNDIEFLWDFGDGGSSDEQDPSYQYSSTIDWHTVMLTVKHNGCEKSFTKEDIVFIIAPLARFTPDVSVVCNPQSFPVTISMNDTALLGDLTDDCTMIWKWFDGSPNVQFDNSHLDNIGNGTTSHNFGTYGTFPVEQVVYNHTTGCSDSIVVEVHISQITAGITTLPNDTVCLGSSFSVSPAATTSTHPFFPLGSFVWDMSDSILTSNGHQYRYNNYGTYPITLYTINEVGCMDTTDMLFTVLSPPQAAINADNVSGCAPLLVNFSNNSTVTNNGVPLSSFNFTFIEDGTSQTTTSLTSPVSHTYTAEGDYMVSLVATDVFGCTSSPAAIGISITKPTASFDVDSVVCNNTNALATSTSTGEEPITNQWFLDGNPMGSNSDFSTLLTGTPGQLGTPFNYTLISTDVNGCKDTISKVVTVSIPTAALTYNFGGAVPNAEGNYTCPPVFTNFTNQSTSFGNITNFSWNFGDGKTSTLTDPNNIYVFPGTYSMSLIITDEFGCQDSTGYIDYLTILGPTAKPIWNQSMFEKCGQVVNFELTEQQDVHFIEWTLGDGTVITDLSQLSHEYANSGEFAPFVTIKDNSNCSVIYPMDTIEIVSIGLLADFSATPSSTEIGQEIILTDLSTTIGTNITQWSWHVESFGDVINSTGDPVSIGYGLPGTYQIVLIVQDDKGCYDTHTETVVISGNFSLPNVFSPNNDGVNEFFTLSYDIFESYDIIILNRWGNVVSEKLNTNGTILWDGFNKGGNPCTEGVYFYKFVGYLQGTSLPKEGFVTLVR